MTAMDITIHATFLPHDNPPAAGQAHSNTSSIARGRSSNGRSEHEANAKEQVNAEEMTTAHERHNPIKQERTSG
jgi:hypothetical protein